MAKDHFYLVAALVLGCFATSAAAQVSSGTAFAVAPGLLITNQHVIAGCSSVDVIVADGRRTGSVVDADDRIDLALLRVPVSREQVLIFATPAMSVLASR